MARELDIVKYPNPILRKQAVNVTKIDDKILQLVDDMYTTLRAANGAGLAANQVGSPYKIFVYNDGTDEDVVINPKIIRSKGDQFGPEGCLSIPGLQGDVHRANEIVATGLDLNGKPVKIKAEGFRARIFQHEIDHLHGIVFIDKVEQGTLYYVTDNDDDEEYEGEEE